MASKYEQKIQADYLDYLAETGINVNAMTYVQYIQSRGLEAKMALDYAEQLKKKAKEQKAALKDAQNSAAVPKIMAYGQGQNASMQGGLTSKEMARMGMKQGTMYGSTIPR